MEVIPLTAMTRILCHWKPYLFLKDPISRVALACENISTLSLFHPDVTANTLSSFILGWYKLKHEIYDMDST